MSQFANSKKGLSQIDIETLSQLKLPISPMNNPNKLEDFLKKRQN